jgi:hypothetical protein
VRCGYKTAVAAIIIYTCIVSAKITPPGAADRNLRTGIPAETAKTQAAAPVAEQPKAPKKPRAAAHRPNVAPSKARSAHKATPAKKATKRATSAKSPKKKTAAPIQGSKTAQVVDRSLRVGGNCKLIPMGIHMSGGYPVKASFDPRWGQMRADSGIWRFLAQNSATRRSRLLGGGSGPWTRRGVRLDPVKTPVMSNKRQPPGTSREAGVAGMILSTLPFSR